MTILPEAAREPLLYHIESVRRQYESDLAQGFAGSPLPGALGKKYPSAAREWTSQYMLGGGRLHVKYRGAS